MAKRLEAAIARVIAEGKVRPYNTSGQSLPALAGGDTDSRRHGLRRGEGGDASTLDVARAVADYASS
jgi:hypothetical protein